MFFEKNQDSRLKHFIFNQIKDKNEIIFINQQIQQQEDRYISLSIKNKLNKFQQSYLRQFTQPVDLYKIDNIYNQFSSIKSSNGINIFADQQLLNKTRHSMRYSFLTQEVDIQFHIHFPLCELLMSGGEACICMEVMSTHTHTICNGLTSAERKEDKETLRRYIALHRRCDDLFGDQYIFNVSAKVQDYLNALISDETNFPGQAFQEYEDNIQALFLDRNAFYNLDLQTYIDEAKIKGPDPVYEYNKYSAQYKLIDIFRRKLLLQDQQGLILKNDHLKKIGFNNQNINLILEIILNPYQESDNKQKISLSIDQFRLCVFILENFVKYQANIIDSAGQPNPDCRDNYRLYILDSPTGTGKTIAFYSAQLLTSFLYQNAKYKGVESLMFVNTQNIAFQVFTDMNRRELYQSFSYLDVMFDNDGITIILAKYETIDGFVKPNIYLVITEKRFYTIDLLRNYIEKGWNVKKPKDVMFTFKDTIYIQGAKPQYKSSYMANTRYMYTDEINGFNSRNEYVSINFQKLRDYGFFGNVIILPLYNYQFLNMYGIIGPKTTIQSVVYDELDVFYQKETLEQFNKFFFSQFYNLTAKTIVFASATLKVDFLNNLDYNQSTEMQQRVEQQIQLACSSSQIQHVFPLIITQKSQFTITNIHIFQDVTRMLNQTGYTYYYFDIETNLSSYLVFKFDTITIKTPNYFKKILNATINDVIDFLQQFKRIYVSDIILRNHYFRSVLDNGTNIMTRQVRTISIIKEKYKQLRLYQQQPICWSYDDVSDQLQAQLLVLQNERQRKYDDNARKGNINDPTYYTKQLIITFQDDYTQNFLLNKTNQFDNCDKDARTALVQKYDQYTNPIKPTGDIYSLTKKYGYKKLLIKTPFNIQRTGNLLPSLYQTQTDDKFFIFDDFIRIGRGVDIDSLYQVVLIIPMYFKFKFVGLNDVEFKQCIGRVGRFGKLGDVKILRLFLSNATFDTIKTEFKKETNKSIHVYGQRRQQIEYGLSMPISNLIWDKDIDPLQKENDRLIESWLTEFEIQTTNQQITNILRDI